MTKTQEVAKKKKKRINKNDIQLYALLAVPMLLVFVFNYIPMFGIIIAFKDYNYAKGILGSDWVGFKNFQVLTASNDFTRIVYNTVVLNAIFIIVGIICAITLGIILFEITSRRKTKVYQTVLITPNFVSWVVASYMGYAFLHPQSGLVNKLIEAFGGEGVSWYSIPEVWPVLLTIFSVWKHVGMDSIYYYASLMGIDSTLFEAAKIDGANKRQLIWHITLPHLIPLVTILTILKIGGIFRADFGLFYQMTRNVGRLYPTTDVMDTYIFRVMRVYGDMSLSSAAGFLQSVVGFVLVVFTNWAAKRIDPSRGLF